MIGLSHDIQLALDTIIEGLDHRFKIDSIASDEMKLVMKSKLTSFKSAKELLHQWENSPNSPKPSTLKNYVKQLADAGDDSLNILRRALKQKIDYQKIPKTRHYLAIEGKTFILNSIIELEASVIELKNQLESGNIILKENEFKRGFPEKFAAGEFLPLSKYHKDWYNENQKAIVIDPLGSRGKLIELDGLKIQLPKPPQDRKKILFHDKKKEDQYWIREPWPKGLSVGNVTAFYDYIIGQFKRRREGVWFYNKGKATYITGRHWFQLQWGKMMDGGIYPNYRDCQRLLCYHKMACYIDNRCMGQIFLKSRQTGYTYGIVSDSIEIATSTANIKNGLTSMTEDDAKKAFAKMSYLYQELPFFFQPITRGRADSLSKLDFGKPSDLSKKSKLAKDTTSEGYLNTSLDYQATKEKAYDGQSLRMYVGDECIFESNKIFTVKGLRAIKNVEVGDLVLCADGEYREVMNKFTRKGDLYRVKQPYGKDYIVNGNHKLYLEKSYGSGSKKKKNVFITPKEYLELAGYKQKNHRRVCFKGFNNRKDQDFFIDPYIFGVWLGDGTSINPVFTLSDNEIVEELKVFCNKKGLGIAERKHNTLCSAYYVSDPKEGQKNRLISSLRELNVYGNKHIPKKYMEASKAQMLELLAGIIDTDGYKQKGSNVYGIEMAKENLVVDIYNLAKSCGLTVREVFKRNRIRKGTKLKSYTVVVSDPNCEIPVRVERRKQSKAVTYTKGNNITIEYEGIGNYVGLTLNTDVDEEALMVLEDYTLTKNCAKWNAASYIEHINTLLPTIFRGGRVTGKCFLGSTIGKLDQGGEDFKVLYLNSKVVNREKSGYTSTKLYSYFMPAHKNFELCIDVYGKCWEEKPTKATVNTFGDPIKIGSIEGIKNLYNEAKKQGDAALNATYRAFPMTENHAMRDEADSCVFNLTKLMDQYDSNEDKEIEQTTCVRGTFEWEDGIRFSKVVWYPDKYGRFNVWWMPSDADSTKGLRNKVKKIYDKYHPINDYACIGVDSYGSYVKGKNKQSSGAAHAASIENTVGVPANKFLFEYIDKPATQDVFNEDILKAAWFYGIPILAENNRKDFVKYLYLDNCRPFSMNRIDIPQGKLQGDDLVLGGQPMQSKHNLNTHENCIRSFVQHFTGKKDDETYRPDDEMGDMGTMPFNRTIMDWMKFDPSSRTGSDATISTGLALMGVHRHKFKPKPKKVDYKKTVSLLRKYSNEGDIGTFIKN